MRTAGALKSTILLFYLSEKLGIGSEGYHESVATTAMSWKKSPRIWRTSHCAFLLQLFYFTILFSSTFLRPVSAEQYFDKRARPTSTRVINLGPQRQGPSYVRPNNSIKPVTIWVGKQGDLFKQVFTPQTVFQRVGGNVTFQFFPNNHSVVSSTFDNPCEPKETNLPNSFFSSFFPVKVGSDEVPTFTITVQTEDPIFFYCAQGQHCQNGMVGIINPRPDQPIGSFASRAAEQPFALAPGDPTPTAAPPISSSAAADPAANAFSAPPFQTTAPPKGGVPVGVIVGIVLGGIALLALIGVGAGFIVARKRRKQRLIARDEGAMYNENGNLRMYAEEGRSRRIGKWMIGRPRRQTQQEPAMFVDDSRGGSSGSGGTASSGRRGGVSANGSSSRGGTGRSGQQQQPQMGQTNPNRPPPIRIHRRNPDGSDPSIVLSGGYRI